MSLFATILIYVATLDQMVVKEVLQSIVEREMRQPFASVERVEYVTGRTAASRGTKANCPTEVI